MIRVILPFHLQTLASVGWELQLEVEEPVTLSSVLDKVEELYPVLVGTIRDKNTRERRPLLRVFACEQDLSHDSPEAPLPSAVVSGQEPLIILGAIAGG